MKNQKPEVKKWSFGRAKVESLELDDWMREKTKNQKCTVKRQREKVQKMEFWEGKSRKFGIGGGKR